MGDTADAGDLVPRASFKIKYLDEVTGATDVNTQ